jgi:hypothetical protein
VSSIDAISSSDSIVNEFTKKSLSRLLSVAATVYQLNKNKSKSPTKNIFHNMSSKINGIKITPSVWVSNSIKNLKLVIYGKIKSVNALL